MQTDDEMTELGGVLDMAAFTRGLVNDLQLLREGKITTQQARARAELARQALRAVGYLVSANRYLLEHAKEIPND